MIVAVELEVHVSLSDLNNDQLHAHAAYRAAAEAVLRTRSQVDVLEEHGRYRLSIAGRLVQISSKRSTEWQFTNAIQPLAPNTAAIVFVDLADGEPVFYTVPGGWFRRDVERRYAEYRASAASQGREPGRHYLVRPSHVEEWRDEWGIFV